MVLSHLLEFAAVYILCDGQLTTINGHCPEVTQSVHIYDNRYIYLAIHLEFRIFLLYPYFTPIGRGS
jgi:hypothetical protein